MRDRHNLKLYALPYKRARLTAPQHLRRAGGADALVAYEGARRPASEAVGEGLRILGRTFEEHWPEQWLQLMDNNPLLSPASRLRTAAASAETPVRRLYE